MVQFFVDFQKGSGSTGIAMCLTIILFANTVKRLGLKFTKQRLLMQYFTHKLMISTVLATLLVGCGGGSSNTPVADSNASATDSNVSNSQDTNSTANEYNTTITRSGDGKGQGTLSGAGTLTSYDGTYTPIDGEGKKLFALYLLGSDLERKHNAGTNDFNEIVEGYNALSDEQKSKLDIVVAFGGANKEGWKGMKIATIAQIIEDSQDGVYGNSSNYEYVANEANMGHKDSLKLFLSYVKNNYNNHTEKFADMWDHGNGSVFLLGSDDNYGGNTGNEKLSTLKNADFESVLKEIDMKFDLFGFDACLNASMEVAKSIAPYATYMVASQETEPGHGWNYTHLITNYAKSASFETLGQELVDSFVKTENHYAIENGEKYYFNAQSSDGKTLSLANLTKFDALLAKINELGNELVKIKEDENLKNATIEAITNARGYNTDKEDKSKKAQIDLKHFALLLKNSLANANQTDHKVYTLTDEVIKAVDEYVLYSKDDGTRSNSAGVALFSLNDNGNMFSWLDHYKESAVASNEWFNAVSTYQNLGNADTQKPEVTNEEANTTLDVEAWEQEVRESCAEYLTQMPDDLEYATEAQNSCLADNGLTPLESAKLRSNGTSAFKGEMSAFMSTASTSKLRSTNPMMPITMATFNDKNLKQVLTVYGNVVDGIFLTTAVLPTLRAGFDANTSNTYMSTIWNQKWYTMKPAADSKINPWLPLILKERRENGDTVYEAEIDYVDANGDYSNYKEGEKFDYARLQIVVDKQNKLVSNIVLPYTITLTEDGKESILLGKTNGSLKIGDKITFYSQNYDLKTGEVFFNQEGEEITLKQAFNLDVEELEFTDNNGASLDYYYLMMGEDINDNRSFTQLFKAVKNSF